LAATAAAAAAATVAKTVSAAGERRPRPDECCTAARGAHARTGSVESSNGVLVSMHRCRPPYPPGINPLFLLLLLLLLLLILPLKDFF
jgi:hypothetical protein